MKNKNIFKIILVFSIGWPDFTWTGEPNSPKFWWCHVQWFPKLWCEERSQVRGKKKEEKVFAPVFNNFRKIIIRLLSLSGPLSWWFSARWERMETAFISGRLFDYQRRAQRAAGVSWKIECLRYFVGRRRRMICSRSSFVFLFCLVLFYPES